MLLNRTTGESVDPASLVGMQVNRYLFPGFDTNSMFPGIANLPAGQQEPWKFLAWKIVVLGRIP